jgi:hypothetical protein
MTIALAITGGIVIILGAATKIPPAITALVRACIPAITAFRDLRDAFRQQRNAGDREAGEDDAGHQARSYE